MCWLCLEKLSIQEGAPKQDRRSRALSVGERRATAVGDNPAWAFFGILAVVLCVGLAITAPGVLIVLFVLAVPALIRTIMSVRRGLEQAAPASGADLSLTTIAIFLTALGVTTIVGIAASVAFVAVCFPVGLGAMRLTNDWSDYGILAFAVSTGLAVAILVAVSLFRLFWRRRE
jgi:hypothetical protein